MHHALTKALSWVLTWKRIPRLLPGWYAGGGRRLLAAGAEVQARDAAGRTPLHWASENGRAEVVRLLLAAGADVQAKDDGGGTPRHVAVAHGHAETVRLLLAVGAALGVKGVDKAGWTPLHVAGDQPAVLRLLLASGADVTARTDSGVTPLHEAVENAASIRLLLAATPFVSSTTDANGWVTYTGDAASGRVTAPLGATRFWFSLAGGEIPGQRALIVSAEPKPRTRFTSDGSAVTETSPLAGDPLVLAHDVTLRARTFSPVRCSPETVATVSTLTVSPGLTNAHWSSRLTRTLATTGLKFLSESSSLVPWRWAARRRCWALGLPGIWRHGAIMTSITRIVGNFDRTSRTNGHSGVRSEKTLI